MRMTTALTCAEVSIAPVAIGETGAGPSGFEAVACMKRSELEFGRARRFPQGYGDPTKRRITR